MNLSFPELSLVVLAGASGAGKSTFAARHFKASEVISSDFCRALVSDDENSKEATKDAFEVLHFIAAKRLAAGRLTVVDATNVKAEDRKPLVALARQFHCLPVAVVFNLPEKVCAARNESRADRDFGSHVIRQHTQQLRRSLRSLKREGFRHIFKFDSADEVDSAVVNRTPLWNDKRHEHGPFDIIGDVHGCADELEALLEQLGYRMENVEAEPDSFEAFKHPEGRKAVFVGDLVDRGPRIIDTIALVRNMVMADSARAVPGNHDMKLVKKLRGRDVSVTYGLQESLLEISRISDQGRDRTKLEIIEFLDGLVSHYVFDDGKLVVAHAGMPEEMQGRGSGKVRDFALYGETTGETDEFGLPVRYNWAAGYRGKARVVYGHTPVPDSEWLNRTINIDTGCVFGGKLTALRYPELELIEVPALKTYCEPAKPFLEAPEIHLTSQQRHDELLDVDDVIGKRIVNTRLRGNLTIREENAIAALEVMSRFAADPRWLIYLPPTMSPSETSQREGLLEHPAEAFSYFRHETVPRVICQEKHMGSRAIVVLCRDDQSAREHFGITTGECGTCYTRTGRRFFADQPLEAEFLQTIRSALDAADFWDRFSTTWVCLDCELMPWSAKAQDLLRSQYAAVGRAARAGLQGTVTALQAATTGGRVGEEMLTMFGGRLEVAESFVAAYRNYCWPVESLGDLKLAPFHVMATEGSVHLDKDHQWHMKECALIAKGSSGLVIETLHRTVDVTDEASEQEAVAWWQEMTGRGGEGMVIKPAGFIVKGRKGLVQPALKCRGREYLRIIYGPEYTEIQNLERLRARGLSAKRSLALREFALGAEALERFVNKEPLRRIHECVFGVLALESEPVDPRL